MERRITDRDGIEWTLVQAYAGVASVILNLDEALTRE